MSYVTAQEIKPGDVWHRGNRYEVVREVEGGHVTFTTGTRLSIGSFLARWQKVGI